MPSKSESTAKPKKNTKVQQEIMKNVHVNDFEIERFKIDPVREFKNSGEQKIKPKTWNAFPRYLYKVSQYLCLLWPMAINEVNYPYSLWIVPAAKPMHISERKMQHIFSYMAGFHCFQSILLDQYY